MRPQDVARRDSAWYTISMTDAMPLPPPSLSPADLEFGAFIDALSAAHDACMLMLCAFAQGRGQALASMASQPSPTTSTDRHLRYSAGIRKPATRESAAARRQRETARAWGFQ
jgi:hypothetical protein